jgi:regulatory protein
VARRILLARLNDQPRTRAELAGFLAARDVPEEVATRLLDRFSEVGLIDDAAYARAWISSRLTGRGLARRALASELRRKGVPEDIAREALDEIEADDEVAAAHRLVRRKIASMARLSPEVRTRRLVAMLARKGFPAGTAFAVVRDELADAVELLEPPELSDAD